jgi:hypothetical protein
MQFIEKQILACPKPSENTLKLMEDCGCKDFDKFLDHCIYVMSWLAEAKSEGMAVGAFSHDYTNIKKLYSPMLEVISAKKN